MKKDIKKGDLDCPIIKQNRAGLLRGAAIKLENNIIDERTYLRICSIINNAQLESFKPLIYVIPIHIVNKQVIEVNVTEAANP